MTVTLATARRFRWAEVAPYVVAQLLGAFVGALLIVAYVGSRATDFGSGVNDLQGIVAEAGGCVGSRTSSRRATGPRPSGPGRASRFAGDSV
ncbi:MAG: aquaporin family protein [Nocardioides sp.]|nr:aquaporin family protein [Nocardioides sp.]